MPVREERPRDRCGTPGRRMGNLCNACLSGPPVALRDEFWIRDSRGIWHYRGPS